MWNDRDRRRDQLFRTGRVEEVETTALSQHKFMLMYTAASESVQEEIRTSHDHCVNVHELTSLSFTVTTIRLWTTIEEHNSIPVVPGHESAQAYAAASDQLKVVVSECQSFTTIPEPPLMIRLCSRLDAGDRV